MTGRHMHAQRNATPSVSVHLLAALLGASVVIVALIGWVEIVR